MGKKRRPNRLLAVAAALMLVGMLAGLGGAAAPQAVEAAYPTPNVTYYLWATDTFMPLADGTIIYNYGFVGGRSTDLVTYQNSMVPPPAAPKTFVPGALVTSATGTAATNLCFGKTWGQIAQAGGPVAAGCETQLAGNAQFPAPMIWANQGQTVEIHLKNLGVTNKGSPNDPHTVHLHGLDVDAANDGVPETSLAAVPANLVTPGAGNVIVYNFTADKPGTYMYHCHQEADIHVQMGMYGALVIYEGTAKPGGPGTLWGWNYNKDVVLLLSEIDTRQHVSEQKALVGGNAFNPVNYQPQYWLVNGLSFPVTTHVDPALVAAGWFNAWNSGHLNYYDPLIAGSVGNKDKVLIRMINMGFETQPMHMHGFHGKVLGSDQRPWPWANTAPNAAAPNNVFSSIWGAAGTLAGQGLEKQTLTIGSGETYEWLIDFNEVAIGNPIADKLKPDYAPGTQAKYLAAGTLLSYNPALPYTGIAIPIPAAVLPAGVVCPVGQQFAYIGGPLVNGVWGCQPIAGEAQSNILAPPPDPVPSQIFVFHNHDDYKATNNGVYPGGMFTVIIPTP